MERADCTFVSPTGLLQTCQRSRAFLFLNEVRRQNRRNNVADTLAQQMRRYNEDYGDIAVRSGDLEEINSIGVESSESLFGEELILAENDQSLRYTTISYADSSPQNVSLERKFKLVIVAVIFIGLSLIILFPSQWSYSSVAILLLIILKNKLF